MTEGLIFENLPMDDKIKDFNSDKLHDLGTYYNTNFSQRNKTIKKQLLLSKKVVSEDYLPSKKEGIVLVIPTQDALENWQQQSKELAARLKRDKEEDFLKLRDGKNIDVNQHLKPQLKPSTEDQQQERGSQKKVQPKSAEFKPEIRLKDAPQVAVVKKDSIEKDHFEPYKPRLQDDGHICNVNNSKLWNEPQKDDLTYIKYMQEHRYARTRGEERGEQIEQKKRLYKQQ